MKEIITDLASLETPSEPFVLLKDGQVDKEAGNEIIGWLKETIDGTPGIVALSAPQIGVNKRIFCIKFDDGIKTFINPIIIKKDKFEVAPETFGSLPGHEILIARPTDVSVVYYNEDFKYEENKLLGGAAKLFDQQVQLLDGVLPTELGLVSKVSKDGSLSEATEEEMAELFDIYKKFVAAKAKAAKEAMAAETDDVVIEQYKRVKLAEDVINGRAEIVANEKPAPKLNRAQRRSLDKIAKKKKAIKGGRR